MQDLVSIIIPVYNAVRFIEPCIRSVLEQTYPNLEILVVNDGSQDDTIHVIERVCFDYPNRTGSLRFINFTENKGLSTARRAGIQAAKGVYFQTVDADDLIEPDMVSQMLRLIKDHKADVVICNYSRDTEKMNGERDWKNVKEESPLDLMYQSLHFQLRASLFWNKMFRKDLFDRWDLYATDGITHHEDYNVMYRVFWYATRVVSCGNAYYHWRKNPQSSGNTFKKTYYFRTGAYLDSVERINDFFYQHSCGPRLDTGRALYQKVILISLALYGNLTLLKQRLCLFDECSLRKWFQGERGEISFPAKVVGILARYRFWPALAVIRRFALK